MLDDLPCPLGKEVVTTLFVDMNLYHDLISSRSVIGCLYMINKTLIDWFLKLQLTVETATFGSEYIVARTCMEQIIDLRRNTLRYLRGVPVKGESFMFGNNESIVNTASTPHTKLTKQHNMQSYHKTREAIAAGITCCFHHVSGKKNLVDILSKHWNISSVWEMLHPLLFWKFQPLQEDEATQDDGKDESVLIKGSENAVISLMTFAAFTASHIVAGRHSSM